MNEPTAARKIVAEFQKNARGHLILFALTTISEKGGREQYDVDHSRSYDYLFHLSGAGGGPTVEVSGIYFASPGASVKEERCTLVSADDKPPWLSKKTAAIRNRNRTRRLRSLPKSFALEAGWDLLTWLEYNAIQSDSVWCSTCRDCFPETDTCDHCWWCNQIGEWSTPDERCECEPGKGCHGEA